MVVGATELSADGRTAIVVTPVEREQILGEMRSLLEAVQTIIVANNAGDLNTVSVAAREVGQENMSPRSAEFAASLPMSFRKLGMDTHTKFDLLAMDAEQIESTEQVSQQLGVLMGNCVACHRSYRLSSHEVE
jgi:cytochrome c556